MVGKQLPIAISPRLTGSHHEPGQKSPPLGLEATYVPIVLGSRQMKNLLHTHNSLERKMSSPKGQLVFVSYG